MQRKDVQYVQTLLPRVHGLPCRRSGYSAQQSLVLHVDDKRKAVTVRNTECFPCSIRVASGCLRCPCIFPYHVFKPVRGTSDSTTARESENWRRLAALCFARGACQAHLHAELLCQKHHAPCTSALSCGLHCSKVPTMFSSRCVAHRTRRSPRYPKLASALQPSASHLLCLTSSCTPDRGHMDHAPLHIAGRSPEAEVIITCTPPHHAWQPVCRAEARRAAG